MDGAGEQQQVPVGATVVAYNGETLGTIHTVHEHYLLVESSDGATDYEVPRHAVVEVAGDRVQIRVNREALTTIPSEGQSAAHREGQE